MINTNTPIHCEFDYIHHNHLSQIYDGFEKLAKEGSVKLKVNYGKSNGLSLPILKVKINNRINVVYDTLDGFNWVNDSIDNNLKHFKDNTKADFYFKRSYNDQLLKKSPNNCKVFPLGFNYYMSTQASFINKNYNNSLKSIFKQKIKQQLGINGFFKRNSSFLRSASFENLPIRNTENKILFLTRIWDPSETGQNYNKELRERINEERIGYIDLCKKEFGKRFTGGLIRTEYSENKAKNYLLNQEITGKENYLKLVKSHNICVATTGLHNSVGWKMGEYIAASRAIVSEPLHYQSPGSFTKNNNYLEFHNKESLLESIEALLLDPNKVQKLMDNNYSYYKENLEPKSLILNTLKIIQNEPI